MAPGSILFLTEMITSNLPGCNGWPACKADNFTTMCEPITWKMWKPQRLTTLWASTAYYRNSFTVTFQPMMMIETLKLGETRENTNPNTVLSYNTYLKLVSINRTTLLLKKNNSEVVEETVFPPFQYCSHECSHSALEEVHKEIQTP
jgi:hypothetical protein